MPKPQPSEKCGVRLLKTPDETFDSFLEIMRREGDIQDGAIVKMSGKFVINGQLQDCLWTSSPVQLPNDLIKGKASPRWFLKLRLTMTMTMLSADASEQLPSSPEVIVVTITNDPSGNPQTSEPQNADPIFFP